VNRPEQRQQSSWIVPINRFAYHSPRMELSSAIFQENCEKFQSVTVYWGSAFYAAIHSARPA